MVEFYKCNEKPENKSKQKCLDKLEVVINKMEVQFMQTMMTELPLSTKIEKDNINWKWDKQALLNKAKELQIKKDECFNK